MRLFCGNIVLVLILMGLSSSCSMIRKTAIGQTGQIIYNASFEQQVENDWDMFSTTLDSNIKLMESFLSQDKENQDLIISLLKAYVAKGFAIEETYYLEDKLQDIDKEESRHYARAHFSYSRALNYGLRYLQVNVISRNILTKNISTLEKITSSLDANLSKDRRDIESVVYLAQALGGLVNLQKDNMRVISYAPVLKTLFDWSCSRDEKIGLGVCDIFYATYDSSRPRMLGGNPAMGKEKFLQAIIKWPTNWLVRSSLVQYHSIPMLEGSEYRKQKLFFNKVSREFYESQLWKGGDMKEDKLNYTNIFNMIALKRMAIFEKYEKEIF